jgi:hypothetical protein
MSANAIAGNGARRPGAGCALPGRCSEKPAFTGPSNALLFKIRVEAGFMTEGIDNMAQYQTSCWLQMKPDSRPRHHHA